MARKRLKYEVNLVPQGSEYHYRELLRLAISRFKYDGLPDTIPQEILERFLIERGTVAIFKKNGSIWALPVSEYGVGVYWNAPPEYITANPILHNLRGATEYLKSTSSMVYNNSTHEPDLERLQRYSTQLAQIESTIDISLVNMRAMSIMQGATEKERQELDLFYQKLRTGEYSALVSEKMLARLEGMRLMPTNNQMQSNGLRDLYSLRNNVYRQYLRDIGIRVSLEKSQFVSEDEIINDDLLLGYNLNNPLDIRRRCLEKVNSKYDLNISVDINPLLSNVVKEVLPAPAEASEVNGSERKEDIINES